jgi:hypothetical protein
MTRDFLISFKSPEEAKIAQDLLSSILVDSEKKLFEEIDNRGKDIFVVLTYSKEIKSDTYINVAGKQINLFDKVSFVAVKNGVHCGKGYSYFSKGLSTLKPRTNSHVLNINKTVLDYFGIEGLKKP